MKVIELFLKVVAIVVVLILLSSFTNHGQYILV